MRDLLERFGSVVGRLVDGVVGREWEAPSSAPPVRTSDVAPVHPGLDGEDRRRRLLNEIGMVASQFDRHGEVRWDPNGDWLMISRYPLPERWRARWAQLLVLFPKSYPATPPIGFYLDRPGRLRDGRRDSHLVGNAHYTAPDLRAQGWWWYCVRVTDGAGGWRPSAYWHQPDNLWSYMHLIREALTNEE